MGENLYNNARGLLFGWLALVFLFFPGNVFAAESCCIVNTYFKASRTAPEEPRKTTCKIINEAEPCTTLREGDEQCGDIVINTRRDEVRDGSCLITTRTTVECTRYVECTSALESLQDCSIFNGNEVDCRNTKNCFPLSRKCLGRFDREICGTLPKEYCGTEAGAKPSACSWVVQGDGGACVTAVEEAVSRNYADHGGILTPCAYAGNCRDVNDIVLVAVKGAKEVFKWIASFAFVFFVFGGVTFILSFGNAEKVKKGQDMLLAAVIGIIISFGAFLLIDFILDTLQVTGPFRGIGG